MAEFSNYLENKILNDNLANGTPYVSLHTAAVTDAGTGAEVSGGGYARQLASFPTATGDSGSVSTDADISYPTATASFGTVTHIGIWDAVTGGNLLFHSALDSSKTIDTGDIFRISSGNLTVTVA